MRRLKYHDTASAAAIAATSATATDSSNAVANASSTWPVSVSVCATPAWARWSWKMLGPAADATSQMVNAPATRTSAWASSSLVANPEMRREPVAAGGTGHSPVPIL